MYRPKSMNLPASADSSISASGIMPGILSVWCHYNLNPMDESDFVSTIQETSLFSDKGKLVRPPNILSLFALRIGAGTSRRVASDLCVALERCSPTSSVCYEFSTMQSLYCILLGSVIEVMLCLSYLDLFLIKTRLA